MHSQAPPCSKAHHNCRPQHPKWEENKEGGRIRIRMQCAPQRADCPPPSPSTPHRCHPRGGRPQGQVALLPPPPPLSPPVPPYHPARSPFPPGPRPRPRPVPAPSPPPPVAASGGCRATVSTLWCRRRRALRCSAPSWRRALQCRPRWGAGRAAACRGRRHRRWGVRVRDPGGGWVGAGAGAGRGCCTGGRIRAKHGKRQADGTCAHSAHMGMYGRVDVRVRERAGCGLAAQSARGRRGRPRPGRLRPWHVIRQARATGMAPTHAPSPLSHVPKHVTLPHITSHHND